MFGIASLIGEIHSFLTHNPPHLPPNPTRPFYNPTYRTNYDIKFIIFASNLQAVYYFTAAFSIFWLFPREYSSIVRTKRRKVVGAGCLGGPSRKPLPKPLLVCLRLDNPYTIYQVPSLRTPLSIEGTL